MTRGHLGTAPGPQPGSSESKDLEERWGQGSASAQRGPPRARREPSHSDDECIDECRPSTSYPLPGPQYQGATEEEEEGRSGSELEQIFKSFAGVHSESEEEADFQSVNRTFSLTCGVWEDYSAGEEDANSESQSPAEPSSIFYTPYLQQRNELPRSYQTSSSEDDLDVTVEVCTPAASQGGPGEQTQEPKKHKEMTLDSEIGTNPVTNQQVPCPLASGFPNLSELADLSSITCSPDQLQDWVDQDKQLPSPLNRRPPPCNSTPRSPAPAGLFRGLGSREGPVPPLPSLLDTSPRGSSHSLPLYTQSCATDSYATASMGDSTSTMASQSSVQRSSLQRGSSLEETDTTTDPPDFTTASSGVTKTTSQEGLVSSRTLPSTTEEGGNEEEGMERVEGEEGSPDQEVRSMDLQREQGGTRDGEVPEMSEGNGQEKEEEQGGGGDAASMEEEPGGRGLADPDKEEVARGGPTGVAAPAEHVPPSRARGTPTSSESLEETNRAHSTLDEVLQAMLAGGRSPGPVQQLEPPVSVCKPQVEGEAGEDVLETAEGKREEITDASPVPREGKQEMVRLGSWSQPHRVIVLEQTQSVPNQVKSKND